MNSIPLPERSASPPLRGERPEPSVLGFISKIGAADLTDVKTSFVARRVQRSALRAVFKANIAPSSGDLVLARVHQLGQHSHLQLPDGRRAALFEGDKVILAYGARYAPDQLEARLPEHLGDCHLLAGGGLAGEALSWRSGLKSPTKIEPIGLLTDGDTRPLNLAQFALPPRTPSFACAIPIVAVVGTSMNSGKTTAMSSLVRGGKRAGLKVAAVKATGTGAGNDYWMYADSGASTVMDFTDCGFSSTFQIGMPAVEKVFANLIAHAQAARPDLIVIEIADGLLQPETAALLGSNPFRELVSTVVFCAADAMGASAGVAWLRSRNLPIRAITGLLTMSSLAIREAATATGLPVWRREELGDPVWARNNLANVQNAVRSARG